MPGSPWKTGGEPAFIPTIIADKLGALHAVQGILAALYAKASGHAGAIHVEVPMFEVAAATLLNEHLAGATGGPATDVGYPRLFYPDRRPYRTADGWITVLPYTGRQWEAFLRETGRSDIVGSAWFRDAGSRHARLSELYRIVADTMPSRTTAQWLDRLTELDIPCSTIASLADLTRDPHLSDVGFFEPGRAYPPSIRRTIGHPVSFGSVERREDRPPPALGEHSREILRGCDFGEAEIDALVADGAVSVPLSPS